MNFAASIAERAILVDNGQIIADEPVKKMLYNTELMDKHGLEIATI